MLLEVTGLDISLSTEKTIVDDISFKIGKGEMFTIIGGSGSGKTTVCRAIMGILGSNYKTKGSIRYQDTELLNVPRKNLLNVYGKEICLIMQNPMTAFNPSIRIGKQMEKTFLEHNKKIPRPEIVKKCENALNNLGLNDTERILKSYPFKLSGGMLQRIMIATALINNPKLLIADEATTAIDACNRIELMNELKKFCERGMSILFVTHDMRAASSSDKILVMNNGKEIELGETTDILDNPKEEYTKKLLSACILERSR